MEAIRIRISAKCQSIKLTGNERAFIDEASNENFSSCKDKENLAKRIVSHQRAGLVFWPRNHSVDII